MIVKSKSYTQVLILFFLAFTMICCIGSSAAAAKDLFVSPSGNDSVTYNTNNINNPWKTVAMGVASAQAGDTIYLRGGTYSLTSSIKTTRGGSSSAPITLKAYQQETPIITANGIGESFYVEHAYWIFEGLTLQSSNMPDHDHAIITVGYDRDAQHFIIQRCKLTLISSVGHDNISCIRLQSDRSNYSLIYRNVIVGQGLGGSVSYNCGIQYLGGRNVGTKVLNNEIYNSTLAIMVKHANYDTASTGAEIAYNYIHDSTYGFYGNPVYINFHDNLLVGAKILFGDNGGGSQGNNDTINHNTIINSGIELWSPSEGPITNCTITNNIFTTRVTYGSTLSLNSWDYNVYANASSEGAHDIGFTTPVYLRDRSSLTPPPIAAYRLHEESATYMKGSDGNNIGADTTKIGIIPRPSLN